MEKNGELKIERVTISSANGRARLTGSLVWSEGRKDVWFEVPADYGRYLTNEVCDAFVIGLLNYAQRKGYDILSDVPISAELKYRLETILLPSLAKYGKKMYETKILAPAFEGDIPTAGAVGTGISCGVDSLHVLKNHLNHPVKKLRLTHLVINNVGAFREGSGQYDRSVAQARKVAAETGLELVETNSNIAEMRECTFEQAHTYANMFGVLALRKLWGVFFYGSSGYDYSGFSLVNNDEVACGHYDMMTLPCISTSGLAVYSEGGEKTRFEKTADIKDFDIAHRYLNVCVCDNGVNCSYCEKCRRTLLNLDALGVLEKFGGVFDLDKYHKNRARFLAWAFLRKIRGTGVMTNDALKRITGL